LVAEAEEQRLAAEAEEQRRQAEAEDLRLAAAAEEQRRMDSEAADRRLLEAQAEEWRQQAEDEEKDRQDAEERLRVAAEKQAERDRAAEAEMQRLREAMEQEQRRSEGQPASQVAPHANGVTTSFDREPEDALAATHAFEQTDAVTGELTDVPDVDAPNAIEELLRAQQDTQVHIPSQYAREAPPEGLAEEDDPNIADEVNKILRRRRWEKRESPFDGFKSPPGRF
jgi:hypothetical protein